MKALELLPYHARPGVHKASAVVAPSKLLKSAAVETGDLLHVDGQHFETPFSLSLTHTHTQERRSTGEASGKAASAASAAAGAHLCRGFVPRKQVHLRPRIPGVTVYIFIYRL